MADYSMGPSFECRFEKIYQETLCFRELFSECTLRIGFLLIRMIPQCSEGLFIQVANSKGL